MLPLHLGVHFLFLLPDCNFFMGMKEILISFGSQNLTSRFLADVCWRKEFHLLGCAWWQVPKCPNYTGINNEADTVTHKTNLVQWLDNVGSNTFFLSFHYTFCGVRSPIQIQTGCEQLQRLQSSLQEYAHKNRKTSFLSLLLHSHFSGLIVYLALNQWRLEPGEKRASPRDGKEHSHSFQLKGVMNIVRPSQGSP